MNKNYATLTLAFLLFLLVSPIVKGTTISSITIESFPTKGDITTNITITVRGVPFTGTFPTSTGYAGPVLYIIYDDKILVSRSLTSTSSRAGDNTDYTASWDEEIKVPNEYPYSELGQHTIIARVEASDGTVATASTNFDVVNYIAPPEWWRNLPSSFLATIQGPVGLKGDTGAQGVKGDTGSQGPKGDTGIQGLKGDPGITVPIEYVYGSLGLSIIAFIIALIAITRRR